MHNPTIHVSGGIDGTVNCECGWRKYTVYPGRGWGRSSIGIKRTNGLTRREYISAQLLKAYVRHEVGVTA